MPAIGTTNGTFSLGEQIRPNQLDDEESKELDEIFRSKVLAVLKGEGMIHDELIEKAPGPTRQWVQCT